MVDIKHANAYSEVLEILNYISIQDYNKIPKEKIAVFEKLSNKEYRFSYNPNISLDENNVSNITKAIIAILFRDYWATEIQREKIIAKQNYDRAILEEEKRKIYNPGNILKKHNQENKIEENIIEKEVALIEYKESIFKRCINRIKNIFNKI